MGVWEMRLILNMRKDYKRKFFKGNENWVNF